MIHRILPLNLIFLALAATHHLAYTASTALLADDETEHFKISVPGINWRFDEAVMRLDTQEQLCASMKVFTTSAQLLHLLNRRKQDFSIDTMICFLDRFACNPELEDHAMIAEKFRRGDSFLSSEEMRELLILSCRENNAKHVETLARIGANVNMTDGVGWTPFHIAAAQGNIAMLRTLIAHNADKNCRNAATQGTAMHLSALSGQLDSVRYLVEECNMDAGLLDKDNANPLHCAAHGGHREIVKYFIEHCHLDANVVDLSRMTPLHYAAGSDKTGTVRDLITVYHADSLARDNAGETAMHHAASNEHTRTVRYLFNHCPDLIQIRDNDNKPPLMHVLNHPFIASFLLGRISERAKTLVSEQAPDEPESAATNCLICSMHPRREYAGIDDIEALYCSSCIADVLSNPNRTPLHAVAALGHVDIARQLVALRPEYIRARDEEGMIPLHWAAHGGQPQTTAFLLDQAPETICVYDTESNTALRYAASHPREVVSQVILEKMRDRAQLLMQDPAVIARLSGNCTICLESPTQPTTTACCLGSVYCADCIACRETGGNPFCPTCREVLFHEMLLPIRPETAPGHTT